MGFWASFGKVLSECIEEEGNRIAEIDRLERRAAELRRSSWSTPAREWSLAEHERKIKIEALRSKIRSSEDREQASAQMRRTYEMQGLWNSARLYRERELHEIHRRADLRAELRSLGVFA